jgi:PhnB protein
MLLTLSLATYGDDKPKAKLPTSPSNAAMEKMKKLVRKNPKIHGETITGTAITPYLFFGGRCAEALEFYRKSLGAEVETVMRYDESPQPPPPGFLAAGFEKKIMHALFRIGGVPLMAADGRDDKSKSDGVWLALTLPTEADCRRAFDALADGGIVQMPLTKTFNSPCFGMVTDRFGLGWMVTVPKAPAN